MNTADPTLCKQKRMLRAIVWAILTPLIIWPAPAVLANGTGKTVYLGYVPEISNWGNYEAGGQAYINVGEGLVRLQVHDLPPDQGIDYWLWLVPAEELDSYVRVGSFTVDDKGAAQVELHAGPLPPLEYRFMVITAEDEADPGPTPGERRALGGVFPNSSILTNVEEHSEGAETMATYPDEHATEPAGVVAGNDAIHDLPLPVTGASPTERVIPLEAILVAVAAMGSTRLLARNIHRFQGRRGGKA